MTPTPPGRSRPGTRRIGGPGWLTAIVVVLLLGWATGMGTDDSEADAPASAEPRSERGASAERGQGEPWTRTRPRRDERAERDGGSEPRRGARPRPSRSPAPEPEPAPHTVLVSRVIDGDTLEVAGGQDVRLVGIDTPEVGECGYEQASAHLARLVLGQRVRLTRSDEDRDRYGRLLRYVDIGDTDTGLRLIKHGLAIARYDSRDGYGFHRREPVYVAADRTHRNPACARTTPPSSGPEPRGCAPGYSPCVPPYPPDVDCADVGGPVRVTGSDPHGLDADGDGVACE